MINFISIIVILLVVGSAVGYLYKSKKRGQHCVGCPYAKQCQSGSCNGHLK